MAYFIHNKYDKNSIAALALIDQSANTVIDYYGNYNTYKYLDVSAGFGKLYDTLSYITPNTILFDTEVSDGKSYFNFSSSIIVKSIQRGVITKALEINADITFNINPIDSSKSVISFTNMYIGGPDTPRNVYLVNLDNTSFTIHTVGGPTQSNLSYQIIEYY